MAEGQEVTKFEPINFVEKLRDKMKQSMIDLIPEEQWNTMLKTEIDNFFNDKSERNAYSHSGYQNVPSDFKQAVRRILNEEVQKKVKDMLHSPEWTSYWNGMEQMTGEKLAELLKEHGASILNNWLAGAVREVVSNMRNHQGNY